MLDTTGKMHSLIDNAYLFILDIVVTEYNMHMVHPVPVFKLDMNGVANTTETTESKVN